MSKFWIFIILFNTTCVNLVFLKKLFPEPEIKNLRARSTPVSAIKTQLGRVGKKVEVLTFSQLQQQVGTKKNDTLYVINFWATWCKPCVQEMPFFEESAKQFSAEKVKIIYVSLNSVKETASVEHFTETKKIQNRVLLLNAPNPNDWIDKVDPLWSGAIPATVMYKNGKKVFFKEGGFSQEEINSTIINKTK